MHADTPRDPHTPRKGFWRSHAGWFLTRAGFRTDPSRIGDLLAFPELRWLDRYDTAIPVALAVSLYALGAALQRWAPALGTSGPQLLVWGFLVSTVVLFHATVTINSLAHRWGRRRYATRDDSRNNWLLALITFGEGWHNNHHFFPGSAPGIPLVGNRPHLVWPARHAGAGPGARPQTGAGVGAAQGGR